MNKFTILPLMAKCPVCGGSPYCEEVEPWDKRNGPVPWSAGCYKRSGPEHFIGANGATRIEAVRHWNSEAARIAAILADAAAGI